MPYARPTLSDLQKQVASDLSSSLPGTDPLLRFSNISITGKAQANLTHLHYGYLDWIAKQAVPYTAEGEFLEAWAALKNVYRKAAAVARGAVTLTGTPGRAIPAVTPLLRGDGQSFTTIAEVTVGSGGTVVALIKATADPNGQTGAIGNTDAGTKMSLGTAIAGVQSGAVVSTACTGGADIEKDDSLRARMLSAWSGQPQGGASKDYVSWATEVAGVTRAWCNPHGFGAGTVVVYTMFDDSQAAHGGFPQGTDGTATDETRAASATGDQLAVADHIFPLQPATALIYSVAPVADDINFTISGLSGASAATKALVAAAIDGVFFLSGSALGGEVDLSLINSAIGAISGTTGFVITVPAANITTALGYLPVRGTVTYI